MNRTSLLFWFPKIKGLGIPVPRTEILSIARDDLLGILDGDDWPPGFIEEARRTAQKIGYPLFLRTDLASDKHNWKRGPYLVNEEALPSCIFATIEFNTVADLLGLPFTALIFREFIPLESAFTAPRYGDLPIARERRYFIHNGDALCHHPYWIEEAVAKGQPVESNWVSMLAKLNREGDAEIALLTHYAKKVASILANHWSIDFAKAADGRWLLIDMAIGEESWHPKDCPNARSAKGREDECPGSA